MIFKLQIYNDNKLILQKFQMNKINDKIIITTNKSLINVPIFNNLYGLEYFILNFPLELLIYDNGLFNPYILLTNSNTDNDNEIDFFINLEKIIKTKFNLNFIKFNDLSLPIILNCYNNILNYNEDINALLFKLNLLKLNIIYSLINNIELDTGMEFIKNYKFNIYPNDNEILLTFHEWMSYIKTLKITNLHNNRYYYISYNKNYYKVKIININKKYILLNNNFKISLVESDLDDSINYIKKSQVSWYYYYPELNLNLNYLLYCVFVHENISIILINYLIKNDSIDANNILNYYKNNKLSHIIDYLKIGNLDVLRTNSVTDSFFKNITLKYFNDEDNIYEILQILFLNYNYPLKINRHDMDDTFDYILYISLYNYKLLYDNDILKSKYINILPIKVKNLYLNVLKILIQVINNNFTTIIYNQKCYNDYLHRNIIKIFLSDSNKTSVNFFKSLISDTTFEKFKSIFTRNLLLVDISLKLSWNTLSKKLNYLNIFYKNTDIIYFQNKINKNIIFDNFDIRIKKIIENPFEMYKFLKKEFDFIKWTKFISDTINNLYYINISLDNNDINNIGKMIYLLFNINEQNIKEISYINFINFCINHSNLIINNNRINLKIKEYFQNLKCSINLGYLVKDLINYTNNISFDEINHIDNKNNIEAKLCLAIDKYLKYKGKYLKIKNGDRLTIINSQYNNNILENQ